MKDELDRTVAAAQRLVLALRGQLEYQDYEKYDDDFHDVVWLLEECRDVLHPVLEERERSRARSD